MAVQGSPDLTARREAIVRAHIEAENRHDAAATAATFDQPRYDVVPLGAIADGSQAVTELLDGLFAGFPDFHVELLALHHSDTVVAVEVRLTGTHRGPWAGLAATGLPIDIRTAAFFEFDGERLLCERVYFDFATLVRQLGGPSQP
jgi:steroid delta-isomerase-like uncharacterized protein